MWSYSFFFFPWGVAGVSTPQRFIMLHVGGVEGGPVCCHRADCSPRTRGSPRTTPSCGSNMKTAAPLVTFVSGKHLPRPCDDLVLGWQRKKKKKKFKVKGNSVKYLSLPLIRGFVFSLPALIFSFTIGEITRWLTNKKQKEKGNV